MVTNPARNCEGREKERNYRYLSGLTGQRRPTIHVSLLSFVAFLLFTVILERVKPEGLDRAWQIAVEGEAELGRAEWIDSEFMLLLA